MAASDTLIAQAGRKDANSAWGQALLLAAAGLFVFFWQAQPGIGDAMRLALKDSDDALRLVNVRDLLAGQGWFDTTQHRFMPPDGLHMHWSRLLDAAIAGAMQALTPLFGGGTAEKLVVTGWPPFLFVVYGAVLAFGSWRLLGARAVGFAIFVAGPMIVFADIFAPERIDHHNVQVILIAAMAFGFGHCIRSPRAALMSGACGGLSLAIGLETMPLIAVIGIAFVTLWIVEGERAARALRLFGLGIGVAALAFFAAQVAPSTWSEARCDALSIPWLLLTSLGGLAAIVLSAMSPRLAGVKQRLAAAALLGAVPVISFSAFFPACFHGPAAGIPQPYRDILLAQQVEAFPFAKFLAVNPSAALQSYMPILVGAVVATAGAWFGAAGTRAFLALAAALLWLGALMGLDMIRGLYITSALLPPVAGWLLDRVMVGGASMERSRVLRVASVAAGVAMFGMVWGTAVMLAQSLIPGEAKAAPERANCDDPRYLTALDALPPGIVIAQNDLGTKLLVHTHHAIVVGGYSWSLPSIIAGGQAFEGKEADLRHVVDEYRADYLAICPNWLTLYRPGTESFAALLANGRSVPWLAPVDLSTGPLKVWRVLRDQAVPQP